MRETSFRKLWITVAALILGLTTNPISAANIAVSGDWSSLSIDALDLEGGAGTDLISEYESPPDQGSIDISGTGGGGGTGWRVDVKRTDTLWHPTITLSIRRWGDGTGAGSISGGVSYLPVNVSDTTFFSGSGDRFGVHFQMKIGNVSVMMPPNTYSTTLTYTVVER